MTEAFAVNFCFLGYTSLCTLEQRNRCYPFGVEIFEKVDSTLLHYFKQSIAAEKRLNPCHGRLCSKHWYEPWQITGKGRWHLARAGKWFVLGLIGGMIEPVSPALHGRLLTTEPPGKSSSGSFMISSSFESLVNLNLYVSMESSLVWVLCMKLSKISSVIY